MPSGLSICSHELLVWSAPVLVAGGFVYWSGLFHVFGLTTMFQRYGVSMLVKVIVGAVLTFATTQWSSNRARLNWEKQLARQSRTGGPMPFAVPRMGSRTGVH